LVKNDHKYRNKNQKMTQTKIKDKEFHNKNKNNERRRRRATNDSKIRICFNLVLIQTKNSFRGIFCDTVSLF